VKLSNDQLIAKAEAEVFTQGCLSTDTHFALLNAGLDAGAVEEQIINEQNEVA